MYVKQPVGYEDGTGRVYKLNKSLHCLEESPKAWYECFNIFVLTFNFQESKWVISKKLIWLLFVRWKKYFTVYILYFVYDLLICCNEERQI